MILNYCSSRKNSLELIELSSIQKLVYFRFPPVPILTRSIVKGNAYELDL